MEKCPHNAEFMVQPGVELLIEQQRQEMILNAAQNGIVLPENITNPLGIPSAPESGIIPGIPGLSFPIPGTGTTETPTPETPVPTPETPVTLPPAGDTAPTPGM